jgi:membrane protease YdiL (CAAX protease family)
VTTVAPSPRRPYPLWPTLGSILLVLAAGFFAMIVAGIPTVITLGSPRSPGDVGANIIEAAFYLGGVAALIPLLERLSQRTLPQLGLRPLDKFSWGLVAVALAAMLALQVVYQAILGAFHQQNHVQAGFEHFKVFTPAAAAMVLINGAVVAPIAEELFFRGLIFNALAMRMPMLLAAVISGIVFGIGHGDLVLFPALAVFGTLQAIFYRISGNLIVPMIVHAANNAIFLTLMIAVPGFR